MSVMDEDRKGGRTRRGKSDSARKQPILAEAPRENLSSHAERLIREALMSGKFPPGEKLNIGHLAEMLGTSATPVREALFRLAAEHSVEMRPAHSARVPLMTRERYTELFVLRNTMEGLACELATKQITDGELDDLRRIFKRISQALQARDPDRFLTHSREFRFALYKAARMPILFRMIESLWVQSGPTFKLSLTDNEELRRTYAEALAALGDRDEKRVRSAIAKAIDLGTLRLRSSLDD